MPLSYKKLFLKEEKIANLQLNLKLNLERIDETIKNFTNKFSDQHQIIENLSTLDSSKGKQLEYLT